LYDPQTKLLRFGARDYDSTLGRWTAKDPAGFPDVSVCGFANAFVYSCQQPVDRADYLGLLTVHDGCPKALIEASWAEACRWLQNPKCAETLKEIPTDVWGGSLFDCMRDNCGKSGCLEVRCGPFKEICGLGYPADIPVKGCTVLFALDQSRCEGGPAATMFHEMLHVCGLRHQPGDPRHQQAMQACRGIPQ
jgi:RHS repeat-associated protein